MENVKYGIKCYWKKWRKAPGVLCDSKNSNKLKGKFQRSSSTNYIIWLGAVLGG